MRKKNAENAHFAKKGQKCGKCAEMRKKCGAHFPPLLISANKRQMWCQLFGEFL
jgi:hypothetical protein